MKITKTLLSATDNDRYLVIPVLLAVLAGAFLADARTLAVTVLTMGLFALPGFLLLRPLTASAARALVYGLPLGYSLTGLLIITVAGLRGWDLPIIALAYLLGVGALMLLKPAPRTASASGHEAESTSAARLPLIVALGLGVLVLAVCVPLAHAGALTANGYAYTGLFGHDFILRGIDSVAIANSIPSDNYFFYGERTYNYYILWYILPATVYNLLNKRAEITGVISIIDLLNVPIFGALVYYALTSFARTISDTAASVRLSLIFVVLFVLSYSYHWPFFLLTQFGNIDTVPGMAQLAAMGPVSTSWFKDLLFQPHSILALMQVMVAMHLALAPAFRSRGIWLGILLGSLLLTDTVIFLVAAPTFAVWYLTQKNLRTRAFELCALAATGAAIVALAFALKIFIIPEYSNRIVISPYAAAIVGLPALLLLCLGPLPVFGLLALKDRAGVCAEQRRLLLILLAISLFFMLFVTETMEGNVFLRKSLMTLRLPLIILSAWYLHAAPLVRARRIALLMLALALPTFFTDIYASSNVDDARYTTYVPRDEMAAAAWLREHTGQHAVVQSLIEYPARFEYSVTIIFGERPAALGVWKMAYIRYPNREAITRRVQEIQTLFSTADTDERVSLARALHIDYIFVGPRERARFPGIDARLTTDRLHFKAVYASATVQIYQLTLQQPSER